MISVNNAHFNLYKQMKCGCVRSRARLPIIEYSTQFQNKENNNEHFFSALSSVESIDVVDVHRMRDRKHFRSSFRPLIHDMNPNLLG